MCKFVSFFIDTNLGCVEFIISQFYCISINTVLHLLYCPTVPSLHYTVTSQFIRQGEFRPYRWQSLWMYNSCG